jgi:hypothetical protein
MLSRFPESLLNIAHLQKQFTTEVESPDSARPPASFAVPRRVAVHVTARAASGPRGSGSFGDNRGRDARRSSGVPDHVRAAAAS